MTTEKTEAVICTSCRKPKNALKQKKSKALPGSIMFLCTDCIENRREPRSFVVLGARQFGADHVSFWIKPQRYLGEPITLRELD